MNRREFLGNLIAGAAAIVGAGMVAPQVEASVAHECTASCLVGCSLRPAAEIPNPYQMDSDAALAVWEKGLGTWEDLQAARGRPVSPAPGEIHVMYGIVAPLTFEAMAQDCAARGCPMTRQAGGWAYVVRHPVDNQFGGTTLCTDSIEKLDAWRRSLHEQADTLADARAEGYADGHIQATQRAQSRVAEGLTV